MSTLFRPGARSEQSMSHQEPGNHGVLLASPRFILVAAPGWVVLAPVVDTTARRLVPRWRRSGG